MPLSPSRISRIFRYAMYFDGVDDYVQINDNPSLNPSSEISIMLVFAILRTDRDLPIVDKRAVNDWPKAYNVYWEYLYKCISFQINGVWFRSSQFTSINTFVHYSASYSQSQGVVKIYLNGSLDKQYSYNSNIITTTYPLWIGDVYPGFPRKFNGYIAQVLIYSRALSDSEIRWNYQYPDNPVRNSLVLWLKADPQYVKDIDGDGILEWIDLSGYNNHGKIYGAQLVQLVKSAIRILPKARILKVLR